MSGDLTTTGTNSRSTSQPHSRRSASASAHLQSSSGGGGGGSSNFAYDVCPSCRMPFDKGRKRKLVDTCGHERCYSCMFRNEACPLCLATGMPLNSTQGETCLMSIFVVVYVSGFWTLKKYPVSRKNCTQFLAFWE